MTDNDRNNRVEPNEINESNLSWLTGFSSRHDFLYISVKGESQE